MAHSEMTCILAPTCHSDLFKITAIHFSNLGCFTLATCNAKAVILSKNDGRTLGIISCLLSHASSRYAMKRKMKIRRIDATPDDNAESTESIRLITASNDLSFHGMKSTEYS